LDADRADREGLQLVEVVMHFGPPVVVNRAESSVRPVDDRQAVSRRDRELVGGVLVKDFE
jgi:hypothetical protein